MTKTVAVAGKLKRAGMVETGMSNATGNITSELQSEMYGIFAEYDTE